MLDILKSDTLQIFKDWGVAATLEEVQSYYDPETAQMEESVVTSALTVLAGEVQSRHSPATAAIAPTQKLILIVAVDDFPLNVNLNTARVIFDESTYKVELISHSHLPGTVALECFSDGF
ncbi:hypothetical protein [Thalassoglobus sp.]|uniref:hypothetical protein n=1 Tax=Thalassoglobus sp. TaxID=2795869 RepID=UPI003AA8392E